MRRVRFAVALAILAALGALLPAAPAGAATTDPSAESRFLTLLNMARAGSGRPLLVLDPLASNVGRNWANNMAATNVLGHNPSYVAEISANVTNAWTRVGENVGVGGNADSLHQAFWNSTGHRENMLGDYNRVGIGAVQQNGRLWVTFNFLKGPAISGTTGVGDCAATPGYLLDGFGGVHSVGGAVPIATGGYWSGWDIARDLSLTAAGKGYKLDGFGGLHPVGGAPYLANGGYWRGWDIATAVTVTPDGRGAYVLDGYGGIHAAGAAPAVAGTGYWVGWRIAKDIQVNPATGTSGYVLDGFGGLHPFGGAPSVRLSGYWQWDNARSFVFLPDGTGGYVVDATGGLWPFAVGNASMPPALAKLTPIELPNAEYALVKSGAAAVVTNAGARLGAGSACAVSAPWGRWDIIRSAVTAS